MKFKDMLAINLHLFDGGAAAGGAAGGAGAAASGDGGAKGDTNSAVPGSTRRGKSGEFSNVLFGKQNTGAAATGTVTNAQDPSHDAGADNTKGVQSTSDTLEDRRKAFRDMVNGEFKDVFTEETQRIINRRFSDTRNLEAQVQAQQPVIDMLMQRYNIGDGDLTKLSAALENDTAYWSEAAEEAGMSVEQYKEFQKMKRENEAFRAAQQGRQQQEARQQQAQKWYMEAQEVKAKFPEFDLAAELKDPAFTAMLRSGTPVEHAYKVRHFDELMDNAMQVTAANTERRVVGNVRARGARPAENGTTAQSAFTIKDDVSKLSKKDRAEIARQSMRGAKIVF
ncbi:MAG: hypothetical protein IJA11_08710 [Oscillospiraceae bacterium]|nr:hypothetical protein [Oscillospiraceae bacterium]